MSELGTYHGASTIMLKTLDWNRSRISMLEVEAGWIQSRVRRCGVGKNLFVMPGIYSIFLGHTPFGLVAVSMKLTWPRGES
jgi:hypothetical protein